MSLFFGKNKRTSRSPYSDSARSRSSYSSRSRATSRARSHSRSSADDDVRTRARARARPQAVPAQRYYKASVANNWCRGDRGVLRWPPWPSLPWKKIFKRILQMLMIGSMLAAMLWCVWSFRQYNQLPISKVQVVATYEHVDPAALQKVIVAHLGNNFFDVNMAGLKEDVLALPWVQEIAIRRKWPDTIIIHVEEHKPIAQWKKNALLGVNGRLFTPPRNSFPQGLPLLVGPEVEVQEIIKGYQQMYRLFQPIGLRITRLEVNEQNNWLMVLNERTLVYLGNENILLRAQNLAAVYPKIVATYPNRRLESLDLRYRNGVAVRWVGEMEREQRVE
jgi:cell division protein FtsQ